MTRRVALGTTRRRVDALALGRISEYPSGSDLCGLVAEIVRDLSLQTEIRATIMVA